MKFGFSVLKPDLARKSHLTQTASERRTVAQVIVLPLSSNRKLIEVLGKLAKTSKFCQE